MLQEVENVLLDGHELVVHELVLDGALLVLVHVHVHVPNKLVRNLQK